MLEQKKVTLEIAGIPMPSFVQLMLKQSINEHHYFEITLDIQAIEAYGVEIPEASKDWVGKKVIMDFGGTIFVGVVTMVEYTFCLYISFWCSFSLIIDRLFCREISSEKPATIFCIVSELQ